MILGIAYDDNSSAAGQDFVALGNAFHRVIGALGMKIWMNFTNDGAHVFFGKNNDSVNILQRGQNLGALGLRHHRPSLALQGAHGSVAVHRDNHSAPEFASRMQIAYMADMEQIEAAVGENDALPRTPPIRYTQPEFVARNNLPMD